MAMSGTSESEEEATNGAEIVEVDQSSQQKGDSVCVVAKPMRTSTPISIIIQSLIRTLVGTYEHNDRNARELYDRICGMLYDSTVIDESYNMTEFEGIRAQYQRAFHNMLTSTRTGSTVPLRPMWPNSDVTADWSHYRREFDEVEFIAGGGFGRVYRVKHKLDGTEYAVKKIFIRSEGIKSVMNYLSEVKTFASLNHSNIVQYKAAWLELGAVTDKHVVLDEFDDTETSSQTNSASEMYLYPHPPTELDITDVERDDTDFRVTFEESRHYSYTSSERREVGKRTKRSSISEGGNAICTVEEIRRLQTRPHSNWATLFIQMALCQSTLKQWLETRNSKEVDGSGESALVPIACSRRTNTVMEILRQLLKGLEYIHSKGIVHHDIKPSNIFMQLENGSLLVQLGDFGLACPLQSAKHTLAFGTKLYAAPEQLSGKCDPKSDMYSLGIVAFELTETFQTDMERVRSITDLRKGRLPSSVHAQHPQLAHVIGQLVVRQPSERPDATTLLKVLSIDVTESEVIQSLQSKLAEKDEEICRLKELLRTAGIKSV